MRNVCTSRFHPFSRPDLRHVSENKGFRLEKRIYFEEMCLRCSLHARSDEVATKSLRSCNEVATKLDPSRIPCASPASPHPSIKEAALRAASTKGGGRLRRPPPFVDSFMDGCGEAGEAQGILDGSNFVATSLQLRSDFVPTSSDLACKAQSKTRSLKICVCSKIF